MKKTILIIVLAFSLLSIVLYLLPPYVEFNRVEVSDTWGRAEFDAQSLNSDTKSMTGSVEIGSAFWLNPELEDECKMTQISHHLLNQQDAKMARRLKLGPCDYYGEKACQKEIRDPIYEYHISDFGKVSLKKIDITVTIKTSNTCDITDPVKNYKFDIALTGQKKHYNLFKVIIDAFLSV